MQANMAACQQQCAAKCQAKIAKMRTTQCTATKKDGSRCSRQALPGSTMCGLNAPKAAAEVTRNDIVKLMRKMQSEGFIFDPTEMPKKYWVKSSDLTKLIKSKQNVLAPSDTMQGPGPYTNIGPMTLNWTLYPLTLNDEYALTANMDLLIKVELTNAFVNALKRAHDRA